MTPAPEPVADTTKLCDLLGINPRETPELKKCGALMPAAGRGRWLLKSSVQNYCAHLRRLVDLKANDAASLNKELTAKKILKTDMEGQLAELRLEQEKKQLISTQSVKEEGLKIGTKLTAKMQALINDAAGTLAGLDERSVHRELSKKINGILEEFKIDLGKSS
jgi:hypothetical protein